MGIDISIKIVIIFLLFFFLPAPVFAQPCNDLAVEIRAVTSQSFDDYPGLNDMKQDILLILYGRERTSCPEEVISLAGGTKDFIIDFDRAYELSRSSIPDDNVKAVEIAKGLKKDADTLEEIQKAGDLGVEAEDIVTSAHMVIQDFLLVLGKTHAREAENSEVTSEKIMQYKQAYLAYDAAGEPLDAVSNKIKWVTLEKQYTDDMTKADALYLAAMSDHETATSLANENGFFSKVRAYVLMKDATRNLDGAMVYYTYHHEGPKVSSTDENLVEIADEMKTLARQLAIYFIVITIIFCSIFVFLIHRLKAWYRDTYDYNLGNELVEVSGGE
jgi:hypothetical protein